MVLPWGATIQVLQVQRGKISGAINMVHKHDDNNMDVWIHDNPCMFVSFIAVWVWVYWRFLSTHQWSMAWSGHVRPNLKKHTVFQLSNFDPIRISSPGVTCVTCGQRRMARNFCPRLSWLVFDAVVASLVVAVLATLFGSGYAVWEVNGWRPLRSWLGLGQRPWNLKGKNWKPLSWRWWLSSVCPSSWGSLHFTFPPYQIRFVILSMLRFKVQRASWLFPESNCQTKTQMAWGIHRDPNFYD